MLGFCKIAWGFGLLRFGENVFWGFLILEFYNCGVWGLEKIYSEDSWCSNFAIVDLGFWDSEKIYSEDFWCSKKINSEDSWCSNFAIVDLGFWSLKKINSKDSLISKFWSRKSLNKFILVIEGYCRNMLAIINISFLIFEKIEFFHWIRILRILYKFW